MLHLRERNGPAPRLRRSALCAILAACAAAVLAPLAAQAKHDTTAFIPQSLLDAITARPDAVQKVVVQGEGAANSRAVATAVATETAADPGPGKGLKRRFLSISGVSAELTGKQILKLAAKNGILAITPDAPLRLSDGEGPPVSVSAPVVAGAAVEGETLSALPGEWAGEAPPTFAYEWQRCSAAGRPAAVIADAPAAFWRLGEPDGPVAVDATGAGLDGSYVGAVGFGVPGVSGDGAAAFDGVGAFVDVPGVSEGALAKAFTLEAWVRTAEAQADRGILGTSSPNAGALLWLDGAGHYGLAVTGDPANDLTSTVTPTVDAWEHIVGSWDGATLRLYRNGTEIGSQPFGGSPGGAAAPFRIASYGDGSHYLHGAVDDAAVYTHALSGEAVRTHYLGCQAIPGATDPTYTAASADLDSTLRVLVTASNSSGTTSQASEPTAAITAAAPEPAPTPDPAPAPVPDPTPTSAVPTNTTAPAIQGSAVEGETLSASAGEWAGESPLAFVYQWQRCDPQSLACDDIAEAIDASYRVAGADVGRSLQLVVRASNAAGASSAVSAVTAPVTAAPVAEASGYSNNQLWPYAARVAALWPTAAAPQAAPTIAIVDSGIDGSRADFQDRLLTQATFTSLLPNSPGDGRGHGTFVASIAAGAAPGYAGAAPNAKLVSLDVFDDNGMATISDVIAATDWIYANKDTYGIRVANFSLTGSVPSSIQYDPLDRAIEKLWLSGVVVVTAAGNYAVSGSESGVLYAPSNDPFVISVGASDTGDTLSTEDDVAAPWSAFGYTPDGFAKPELGAPGRYLVGAVPPDSTLALERPGQIVAPGYMQLSGTSFAAPVVAGAAAQLLAAHPQWTPDQVKGALMVAARPAPASPARSLGVGVVDAAAAAAVTEPPIANLALADFLVPDPGGSPEPVLDAAAWGQAAASDPAWASAAWGQAAWGQAAWGQAAWGQTYWSSAAWGQGAGAGTSVLSTNAEDDVLPAGGYWITPAQLADAQGGRE